MLGGHLCGSFYRLIQMFDAGVFFCVPRFWNDQPLLHPQGFDGLNDITKQLDVMILVLEGEFIVFWRSHDRRLIS
jgi:hypothetical protein